jgi:hypothetical protein
MASPRIQNNQTYSVQILDEHIFDSCSLGDIFPLSKEVLDPAAIEQMNNTHRRCP